MPFIMRELLGVPQSHSFKCIWTTDFHFKITNFICVCNLGPWIGADKQVIFKFNYRSSTLLAPLSVLYHHTQLNR